MGSGFRTWASSEVVTASDVQNYLQDQTVMVFADSSARSSAISSPEEGMVTYLKDSDGLFVYDGASWDQVFGLGGTVGTDGAGVDVTFYSGTSGDYLLWDASEEKLILEGTHSATVLDVTDGNVVIADGTLTVGSDGAGEDVTFYSDTAGDHFVWDSSAEKLTITGTDAATALAVADGNVTITDDLDVDGTTNLDVVDIDGAVDMASTLTLAGNADFNGDLDVDGTSNLDVVDIDGAVDMASTLTLAGNADFNGDLDVDGTTNLDAVDIDGAVQIDGTVTVGVDDTGHDFKVFGATSGAYMLWDEDVDDLYLAGDARLGVGITATGTARLSVHGGLRFT